MKKTLCTLLAVIMLLGLALPLTYVSAASAAKGDVNGDGDITAADALLTLQCSVGKIELTSEQQNIADVDGVAGVSANDALWILQAAVGKREISGPLITDYADYEYRYVEPTGLTENTMYMISSGTCLKDLDTKRNHDLCRLVVCMQGLINRNNDKHHVAVNLRMDNTDDFWLSYMQEEGATYDSNVYTQKKIATTAALFEEFGAFIKQCGIIVWDPDVPSTANVASTICGLYNYLPVQYSTDENSLYMRLTRDVGAEVKMNLVGMFEDAKLGTKIKDTDIDSSGSSKCDAYLWALEQYMEECNPELLAYTPDGATAVASNWLAQRGDAGSAQLTGIPNHDYFIARQCFFFDLTSYGDETPCDDPDQPLGTDPATLKKIMQKRYDMTGGMYGIALGFPPWHLKYTRHVSTDYDMDPARLEWHFVEFATVMNMGIEADAAHPCWMSNGSLYYKYQMRYSPKGNNEAKAVTYDPDKYYYTIVWSGDFDCSPWMKNRIPDAWANDANRGNLAMTYGYNVNLVQRIPMAYDYIFSQQTDNDYIVGGEGMSYSFVSAMFQGFTGKEASLEVGPSGFYGKTENSIVHRTLPDGGNAYYDYAKPYYDKLGVTVTARLINGFNVIDQKSLAMLEKLSPGGVFVQASTAGSNWIQRYGDLVCMRIADMAGSNAAEKAQWLYSNVRKSDSKFLAFGYCDDNTNFGTPTGFKQLLEEMDSYSAMRDPSHTYQYLDVNTFVDVVKQSNLGYTWDKLDQ